MENKPIDSLNMIPFIDIMLVLLAIVLTTSSFIVSGRIPVQLPEAASGEPDIGKKAEIIEVDATGVLHYDGAAVSLEELRTRLSRLAKETDILLRADKTVQLQRFVDVADVLKQLQLTRIAVQTESRTGMNPP